MGKFRISEGLLNSETIVGMSGNRHEETEFEIAGFAIEFARLNNEKRILDFANKYGMLGVGNGNEVTYLKRGDKIESYIADFSLDINPSGESIDEWKWHIKHVQKLFKLYKTLKNDLDIDDILKVEETIIPKPVVDKSIDVPILLPEFEKLKLAYLAALDINRGMKPTIATKPKKLPNYSIYWVVDSEPTLTVYKEGFFNDDDDAEIEFKKFAWLILHNHIFAFIREHIYLKFTSFKINMNAPIDHTFVNIKATNYLIVAIYYDLFRMVNSKGDDRVNICSQCDRPFKRKRKDADTCGVACRKKKSVNKIDGGNENA
jgi:hypothetical protein